MVEIAYFATGCFWGAERRFWSLHGVLETSVGYMGGSKEDPTYEEVCTGRTGHAEMVQVTFDQEKISYEELLKEFWTMHDPTTLNAQGNDIGSQYRSSIYTTSEAQNELATKTRHLYAKEISKVGYGEIVTEILPATNEKYWPAEEYHQKYLLKNPNGYDCHSSTGVPFPAMLDDDELRARLDPLSFDVLRRGATERPFTGEYVDTETVGVYKCKVCSAELFRSDTKFHSGCGWPSFYAPTKEDAVLLIEDRSLAPRVRTEVRCASCDSHLGHVFEGEGYDVPTDQRWCINSVSLLLETK